MKLLYFAAHEVFGSVIDFIFPPACPVCGGAFNARDIICPDCIDAITECSNSYIPPERNLTHVDNISILLPYDSICRTLIHALKYHGMKSTGQVLGKLMAKKTMKDCSPAENSCIVPVPLHPSKLKERGYNQSERLAEGFASFTGFEVCDNLLSRTKHTGTQTALDHEQRALNVRNAFRYSGEKSLSGRPVIIIDDVMTTGSTISECAKALRDGGAGEILVSVVATPGIGMD